MAPVQLGLRFDSGSSCIVEVAIWSALVLHMNIIINSCFFDAHVNA